MKRSVSTYVLLVSLVSMTGAALAAHYLPGLIAPPGDAPDNDETDISLSDAPAPVREAALKLTDATHVTKVTREEDDDDDVTFELEFTRDGVANSATLSPGGEVMELEHAVEQANLPSAVLESLKKHYPNASFEKPVAVTKMYYEVQVVEGGQTREIKIDPAGEVDDEPADHDQDADANNEGDQHAQATQSAPKSEPAHDDGFRSTFAVAKADLGPTGVNPYFDLTPNTTHTYQEGNVTLTVRVLDVTRMVDGVTTRVIEEREEAGGKPKEISRNYFAIDSKTSDVYYFGEEVDEYDDAGNVTHPGAWISGINGAHFGLFMPGEPKVGQKFYQELAPGLAMDRFEIVSLDATVVTPAGKFEHCVEAAETTPLEKGTSTKWFSRGTGLIKDGDASLLSVKAGR